MKNKSLTLWLRIICVSIGLVGVLGLSSGGCGEKSSTIASNNARKSKASVRSKSRVSSEVQADQSVAKSQRHAQHLLDAIARKRKKASSQGTTVPKVTTQSSSATTSTTVHWLDADPGPQATGAESVHTTEHTTEHTTDAQDVASTASTKTRAVQDKNTTLPNPGQQLTQRQTTAVQSPQSRQKSVQTEPAIQVPKAKPQPRAATVLVEQDQNPQVLLARLRQSMQTETGNAMERAIAAAGLSMADPHRALPESQLVDLDEHQQQQVRQFHQLIIRLGSRLAAGDVTDDERVLLSQIDRLVNTDQPIHILRVELCQRVQGYGVYEPFEDHDFLAGREQPIIVYAELDHFETQQVGKDHFKVRLTQEVILYNESGTLEVWRQPRVNIEDESRNRRRDFFVVQLIHLPSGLGADRYRLKIRISDLANGSVDEAVVPINLVADPTLVRQGQ